MRRRRCMATTTVGHGELRGRERPVDVVGDSRGSRGSRSPGSVVGGLGAKTADLVFHDLSGWLMMPSAMVLLYLLLRLLDWLFIPAPDADTKLRTTARGSLPGLPRVSEA